MDDIDLPPQGSVIPLGDPAEFRRHPEGTARVVPESLRRGDRHPADPGVKIQKLVDLRIVFQKDILARDADVGGAPLHVDRDVGRLDPEIPDPRAGVFKNQSAAVFQKGGTGISRRGEHGVNLFAESSLGKRNVQKAIGYCHVIPPFSKTPTLPARIPGAAVRPVLTVRPSCRSDSTARISSPGSASSP